MSADTKFAVVLDAGSSGTRLYVYKWERWVQDGSLPQITVEVTRDTTHGMGIATCTSTTAGVKAYLDPLFDAAAQKVHQIADVKIRKTIPLYVLGTAGLRDFSAAKPDACKKLIELVELDLAERGYEPRRRGALTEEDEPRCRVISGKEEAIYGWVAANYAARRLVPGVRPHGYAEMGGASTQIAYTPTDQEMASYSGNLVRLEIGQQRYDVYAKSFPFGAEKAWSEHEARLRAAHTCKCEPPQECKCPPIEDPCRPAGCMYEIPDPERQRVGAKIVGVGNDYRRCIYVANAILRVLAEPAPAETRVERIIQKATDAAAEAQAVSDNAERAALTAEEAEYRTKVATASAHKQAEAAKQRAEQGPTEAVIGTIMTRFGAVFKDDPLAVASAIDQAMAAAMAAAKDASAAGTKAVATAGGAVSAASAAEHAAATASDAASDAADKAAAEAEEVAKAAADIKATFNGPYPPMSDHPNPDIYPRQLQQSLDLLADGPTIDFSAREFAGGAQFWYTTRMVFGRDLLGNSLADPFNFLDFRREVQRMVKKPWAEKPEKVLENYWMKAFFVAGFMTNVLYYGFNFPRPLSREDRNIFQPYNGENNTLTWTLGKILLMAVDAAPKVVARTCAEVQGVDWMDNDRPIEGRTALAADLGSGRVD